jgi:diaminopimelate decarboxylase
VLYRKESGNTRFLVVDAAMNDLLRPALYSAYHEIVPLRREEGEAAEFDVVGPVCESGDFLAQKRLLPVPQPGDLLAVMSAGAYGSSMSSNYNSRGRAAEVLVDGAGWRVVRRRETIDDQLRLEEF